MTLPLYSGHNVVHSLDQLQFLVGQFRPSTITNEFSEIVEVSEQTFAQFRQFSFYGIIFEVANRRRNYSHAIPAPLFECQVAAHQPLPSQLFAFQFGAIDLTI